MVVRCWSPIPPRPIDSKRQISHGASCIIQPGGQLSTGHVYQTQSLCGLGCYHSSCELNLKNYFTVCLLLYIYIYIYIYIYTRVCPSINMSVYLFVKLCVCVCACVSICLPVILSDHPSMHTWISGCKYLSVPICLPIYVCSRGSQAFTPTVSVC